MSVENEVIIENQDTTQAENTSIENGVFLNKVGDGIGAGVGFFKMIKFPCILVSLLATIACLLSFLFTESQVWQQQILPVVWGIGIVGALLSGPWKYIKTFLKFITKGWSIGWVICPFVPACFGTAFGGALFGLVGAGFLTFITPAVIGFYYYFKD